MNFLSLMILIIIQLLLISVFIVIIIIILTKFIHKKKIPQNFDDDRESESLLNCNFLFYH